MFKNYLKIAVRSISKNKTYSFINIGGLALGLTVAMLIGLWIHDEKTFNTNFKNHDHIAQVLVNKTNNGEIRTRFTLPYPLAAELRSVYAGDFKYVVMSSFPGDNVLSFKEKNQNQYGAYMEKDALRLFSFTMLKGNHNALNDPNAIVLSASAANALFGNEEPIGKTMRLNDNFVVTVKGVFEDLPTNANVFEPLAAFSESKKLDFIAPWDLYVSMYEWVKTARDRKLWDNNSYQVYVAVSNQSTIEAVSHKIKNTLYDHVPDETKRSNPEIFLHPMKDWHLKSSFKNGLSYGGAIQYVRMFGIIGVFVLLLACINFMNLSTARSQKRAKEVGIRKTVGSNKNQLIEQFLFESLLVTCCAFAIACTLVVLLLPLFNQLADKQILFPYANPLFWCIGLGLISVTSLLAGSYPALYLSSFRPVRVLKGTIQAGKSAVSFRKVLVVVQFIVSIILVSGTMVVNQQIQHSKNRPIGYNKNGLIMIEKTTEAFEGKYNVLREAFKKSGAVAEMAESSNPMTEVWNSNGGYDWEGKNPDFITNIVNFYVSHDYGKTVGWEVKFGRNFSRDLASDSTAYILNEAAVEYMGLQDPVDKTIRWYDGEHKVIGVVKNMLTESPFEPVKQAIYSINYNETNWINLKLSPEKSITQSLEKIETEFAIFAPSIPFEFQFVDNAFGHKFKAEERMRKLSGIFSVLAIFISCLGLFGLSTFMAERRTKEIGIRKVLGASIMSLFKMLSRDFVLLVLFSGLIAIPVAYYVMQQWLENYTYHISIPWWVFGVAILSVMFIALFTISYQAARAAIVNPVKSLRTQ
ncbi:ABC transporter permease [Flagellimonas meridianipacifica]|uniref:ABC-type antimicrobial peptide transport system permease subunit n=1 Tax=Flagellimonas meridianipacifica TaxID=1080225 RepID=A0A2T0MGY7_9FLAO|nr:ABC transporter permease [Allomuricauda pacifica]PRX56838.1 ABC-type antimicrobial peptide transport system permease subunit [Allomuricauda pacifica]